MIEGHFVRVVVIIIITVIINIITIVTVEDCLKGNTLESYLYGGATVQMKISRICAFFFRSEGDNISLKMLMYPISSMLVFPYLSLVKSRLEFCLKKSVWDIVCLQKNYKIATRDYWYKCCSVQLSYGFSIKHVLRNK